LEAKSMWRRSPELRFKPIQLKEISGERFEFLG